jgi:hypothetical protein
VEIAEVDETVSARELRLEFELEIRRVLAIRERIGLSLPG